MPTARKAKTPTLTDVLYRAIADSGLTFRELERRTGVKRQSLMKFMRREQSLRLDMADKLAAVLALELVDRKAK